MEDQIEPMTTEAADAEQHIRLLERTNARLDALNSRLEQLQKELGGFKQSWQEGIRSCEVLARASQRFARFTALATLLVVVAFVGWMDGAWQPGRLSGISPALSAIWSAVSAKIPTRPSAAPENSGMPADAVPDSVDSPESGKLIEGQCSDVQTLTQNVLKGREIPWRQRIA